VSIRHQVNLGWLNKQVLARHKLKPVKATRFSLRTAVLRKQAGLTMTALSKKVGVTPSYISLLEAGERQPSREIVLRLAEIFFDPNDTQALDELLMLAGLSPVTYKPDQSASDPMVLFEQALAIAPTDFHTFNTLIRYLIRHHQLEAAENRILDGMKRFHNAWQLQALMAHLQLSLHNFEAADKSQQSALELYTKQPKNQQIAKEHADLYTNLGMIHFLWGMKQLEASKLARQEQTQTQCRNTEQAAKQAFQTACTHYQAALALNPTDIFLLDEYAQVRFNIADLATGKDKSQLWQAAIESFIEVVCSEQVHTLGLANVREANVFLLHAHTKSGQFDEARKLIGIMQSCHPDYWLIYYAKAAYFSLLGQTRQEPELAQQGFAALKQALSLRHPQNQSRQYARDDADLAYLRKQNPGDWQTLIESEASETSAGSH